MGTMSNNASPPSYEYKLGNNLKLLEPNDQIKQLQTIIRDRYTNGDPKVNVEFRITEFFSIRSTETQPEAISNFTQID